jgi:iron complex outermembrane receptor protein
MNKKNSHLARRSAIWILALSFSLIVEGPALAQASAQAASSADLEGLHEIVVTATRREAGSQSVPLALTAIGGDQLRDLGITNVVNLGQLAPSLVVNTDISAGSPRYSLRGLSGGDVTPAASPAIATYIDDVPQAAQYGIGAGLFDLQRVEVLRGPQGTTFGKNTTGGAIAYFSQTPTNTEEGYVSVRVGGGDRGEQAIEGAFNQPINNTLAARFSFRADENDDWQRNVSPPGGERGGTHDYSARAQLRWTPDSATYANLAFYLARGRGDQPLDHAEFTAPSPPMTASRTTVDYSPGLGYDNLDNTALTLRIGHDFGLFDLTSITHYRNSRQKIAQDLDATAYDLFAYRSDSWAKQYGEEVRLASDASRPLSGLVGVYYEHDNLKENASESSTSYGLNPGIPGPFFAFFPPFAPINVYDYNTPHYDVTTTNTYAAFGNLTYKFTEALSVTGGARKTIEHKRYDSTAFYYIFGTQLWDPSNVLFNPATPPGTPDQVLPFANRVDAKPWTWDVTIDYNPTRDLLVFGRVAQGYRSGGFNQAPGAFPWSPFFFPGQNAAPPTFAGEEVRSYELGVKSTLLPWLRVNANVYHYNYSNQQVTTFPGGLLYTTNAASSKVDGAELEVSMYPTRQLEVSGSASYNKARYDRFLDLLNPAGPQDYSGKALNQAPRWMSNLVVNYLYPLSEKHDLRMNTNWTYRSTIFFDQPNTPEMADPSLVKGNVRLGIEPRDGKGSSITAYVNNVTDKRPLTFAFAAPAPGDNIKYFSPGMTFGVDLSYRW